MPEDYDGDGRTDLAVFRPTDGKWYVLLSSKNYSKDYRLVTAPWGSPGDWHVPADYEGDGRTDIAVWRPNDGKWYILLSSKNFDHTQAWALGPYGGGLMVPVPADYDNDGRTDPAVSDQGYFSIAYSSGGGAQRVALTEAIGNTGCLYNLHLAIAYSSTSPVLIDTLGNGFRLTDIPGGVRFDFAGAGRKITTAWTETDSDDAFLALDRNENGTIDSGRELFGDITTQPTSAQANGFLALAEYDKPENGGNGDGVIDTLDRVFDALWLWQDSNHNGSSEPGELSSLPAQGISTLGINFAESRRTDSHGNQFKYRARVLDGAGNQSGRWAWDVFFAASDL